MYDIVSIFGPAAIIYYLSNKISNCIENNIMLAITEFLCDAVINVCSVLVILLPSQKVEFVACSLGISLHYGGTAFLLAFILAVVEGLIIAVIKKNFTASISITYREKK